MKAKKVMAVLLAIMVMVTMMPAMTFADVSGSTVDLEDQNEDYFKTHATEITLGEDFSTKLKEASADNSSPIFSFTPEVTGVYVFQMQTNEEYWCYPEICYFDAGKKVNPSASTFDSQKSPDVENSYDVYNADTQNGGVLKLEAGKTYYYVINGRKLQSDLTSCKLVSRTHYNITFNMEGNVKIVGSPWTNDPQPITSQALRPEDDHTMVYLFGVANDAVLSASCEGKLLSTQYSVMKTYRFFDGNNQEVRTPDTVEIDGWFGIPKDGDNDGVNLEVCDKRDEEYCYFTLDSFIKAIGATSSRVEKEFICLRISFDKSITKDSTITIKEPSQYKGIISSEGNGNIRLDEYMNTINWNDHALSFTMGDFDSLDICVLPDDGYELEGVYYNGQKLVMQQNDDAISYIFKDQNGVEVQSAPAGAQYGDLYFVVSNGDPMQGALIKALGLEQYAVENDSDLNSISEIRDDGRYLITLQNVKDKLGAVSTEVKKEMKRYSIFMSDNPSLQGDNITLTARFKKISGGSAPVNPMPSTPTQPTTTVDKTTNPDGSTTTTTTEKDPVSGTETKTEVTQGESGVTSNTEITAETDTKTNGTATESTVDKETADKVLEEAIKSEQKAEAAGATKKTTVITFEAKSLLGNTTKVEMSIPTEFVKDVLDKTDSEIKIKTVLGEVQLSQKTLEKAVTAEETDQIKISVESMAAEKLSQKIVEAVGADAQVLNFKIQAGSTSIHAFDGGKAYITLDIPKTMDPEQTEAVYVKTNGFVERVIGTLLKIGGAYKYRIAADHFSYYALVDKDTAEAAIQKTNQTITKGVKNTKVVGLKAKAVKDKIKLTWKKSNSGYKLDGYQIYKSKKKNAGYKKMMTTAGKYYINTAGVKKGQNYWYKVRGYRKVDGKTVYTDWKKIKVKAK